MEEPVAKGKVTVQMSSPSGSDIALQLPHQELKVPLTSGVVKEPV